MMLEQNNPDRKPIVDKYVSMVRNYGWACNRPLAIRQMTQDEYQSYLDAHHQFYTHAFLHDPLALSCLRNPEAFERDASELHKLCENAILKARKRAELKDK